MVVTTAEEWTIDELAQRAGCSVDTVRFYNRQGLLPTASRKGRHVVYGDIHLDRLRRIQSLQDRHFTLKTIRELAEEGRLDLLESFMGPTEKTMERDELVAESGLEADLVDELEAIGFLPAAKDRGLVDFDSKDLLALRAVNDLIARGMPRPIVLILVRMYLQQMAALQRKLLTTFMDAANMHPDLDADDIDRFITIAANDIEEFLGGFDLIVQYMHHRTLQNLVVQAIDISEAAPD